MLATPDTNTANLGGVQAAASSGITSPSEKDITLLGEAVMRAPVEFGTLISEARKGKSLKQRQMAGEMSVMLNGPKAYGKTNDFDQGHVSRWELGDIGFRRTPMRTGMIAYDFCRYFGWSIDDVVATLNAVEQPKLRPQPTPQPVNDPAGLAPHEATLLSAVVADLDGLPSGQRGMVENSLLELAKVDFDLASILAAGLSKFDTAERVMLLARMFHLVKSGGKAG